MRLGLFNGDSVKLQPSTVDAELTVQLLLEFISVVVETFENEEEEDP